MKICVFGGTFDPITIGHLDIIKRASQVFDKVYVALLINPNKKAMFSFEKRLELMKIATKDIKGVEVQSFSGLMIDFCKKVNASCVVRGIRNGTDFEYEMVQANVNLNLSKDYDLDVMFFPTKPNLIHISSSVVRELLLCGGNAQEFLPFDLSLLK